MGVGPEDEANSAHFVRMLHECIRVISNYAHK